MCRARKKCRVLKWRGYAIEHFLSKIRNLPLTKRVLDLLNEFYGDNFVSRACISDLNGI